MPQVASCNILRICFNGSEMTTCLINDQLNDKRKISILNEETFLESGKLFTKNCQSRSSDTCTASSRCVASIYDFFIFICGCALQVFCISNKSGTSCCVDQGKGVSPLGLNDNMLFFVGITFWRSLETRLNSVAKPTEFVPKPFLACVTFFCHTREFKELRRVVNTSSNF